MSECVDKVVSSTLKLLNLPDTSLDMQGTLGVSSDLKLQDVFTDINRWSTENSENLAALQKIYEMQRNKKID